MMFFVGYLLVITCTQVTGQFYSSLSNVQQLSLVNETTTAVPRPNASTTVVNGHTSPVTTLLPTTTPATDQHTTKTAYDSGSSILSKLTSIATSQTVPTFTGNERVAIQQDFITTTAAPPFVGPTPSYRQFDALSFTGGALLTLSLVILGSYGWKMYMARIERSYWTL